MSAKPYIEVLSDSDALANRAAEWMTELACVKGGSFAVALSGGSTPKTLYELLASQGFLSRFPWDRVHWFWGDERFVPHNDPQSNFGMAAEAMLSHAPVPPENIHPIPTVGVTPEEAAARYEETLRNFYAADYLIESRPLFDVMLLGLGEDGHTASLFPGSAALEQRDRWTAVSVLSGQPRITLTYPALESSMNTAFLVSGADKRDILKRLLDGDLSFPAARLCPQGTLHVFADRAVMGCAC
ncbi:MAG: 6-phosphogluconolactonase [Rhizomicrobium sp.]